MSILSKLQVVRSYVIPPPAPTIKDTISGQAIFNLYRAVFPKYAGRIHISDEWFEITAISELRRFIDWSVVDRIIWTSDVQDCDDVAAALAGEFARYPGWSGFPVTFIWGDYAGGHAFCTAVAWPSLTDRTPTIYYIEPQNDHEIAEESVEDMELWLLPMSQVRRE